MQIKNQGLKLQIKNQELIASVKNNISNNYHWNAVVCFNKG